MKHLPLIVASVAAVIAFAVGNAIGPISAADFMRTPIASSK